MNKSHLFALVVIAACSSSKPASEPTAPSAPASQPPAGAQTQTVTFHSDALGVDKDFVLYLPASYASSSRTGSSTRTSTRPPTASACRRSS